MGHGELDPEAIRLYGAVGKWLKVNGESICATERNPLAVKPEWGDCSVSKDGNALYLHVLQWPESGAIEIAQFPAEIASATFLANGQKVDFAQNADCLAFTLPAKPIAEYDAVIKLQLSESINEK